MLDTRIPYSDTCKTCSPITKIYGCIHHHFPWSLAPGKPRFYVCTFGQHTKVTLEGYNRGNHLVVDKDRDCYGRVVGECFARTLSLNALWSNMVGRSPTGSTAQRMYARV